MIEWGKIRCLIKIQHLNLIVCITFAAARYTNTCALQRFSFGIDFALKNLLSYVSIRQLKCQRHARNFGDTCERCNYKRDLKLTIMNNKITTLVYTQSVIQLVLLTVRVQILEWLARNGQSNFATLCSAMLQHPRRIKPITRHVAPAPVIIGSPTAVSVRHEHSLVYGVTVEWQLIVNLRDVLQMHCCTQIVRIATPLNSVVHTVPVREPV